MSEVNLDIQEINLDGDLNNTNKEISLDTAVSSSVDLKEAKIECSSIRNTISLLFSTVSVSIASYYFI